MIHPTERKQQVRASDLLANVASLFSLMVLVVVVSRVLTLHFQHYNTIKRFITVT